jgi:dTDP-4-dehydrorhamnose reductase
MTSILILGASGMAGLEEGDYDVVINCVGMLNRACDREQAKAIYVNSYLPHLLDELLHHSSTKLIHMSTDCVFSGQTSPYYEDSLPDGTTLYDRSKALGELNNTRSLTFRNSISRHEGMGSTTSFLILSLHDIQPLVQYPTSPIPNAE